MWNEYRDKFGPTYGAGGGGGGSDREHSAMQDSKARSAGFSSRAEQKAAEKSGFGSLGSGLSANSRSNSSGKSSLGIGGASGKGLGSNLSSTGPATSNTSVGGSRGGNSGQGFGIGQNLAVTAPSVSAGAPKFAGEQLAPLPAPSLPSGGNQVFSAAPTLRLTPQGLLLTPNNDPQTSEGNRLGDNQGGDQGQGQTPEPPKAPAAPATPPAAPSPPQQPRQRAAALQRGPAVEQPRTLLTLSLADVTRKSLLGV